MALACAAAAVLWAADWPMPEGNPERNGWAGLEHQLTKANIRGLKLLYKFQTDNRPQGLNSLSAPVIDGNLITYRGFKEMLLFTGSANRVYSVDADLNQLIWESRIQAAAVDAKPAGGGCYGGMTAPVIMAGSSASSLHFAALVKRAPASGKLPRKNPYFPPLSQSLFPLLPTTLTSLNALYTVSSDGMLHILNSSTGEDLLPPVRFVPPQARITSLNLHENVVYATTGNNCDGQANALYAIDLMSPQKTVATFVLPSGGFAGTAGTVIGGDGTIYVQCPYAPDPKAKRAYETVVALRPKDLRVKDYFVIGKKPLNKSAEADPGITPVVFSFGARDVLLAGGREGRLYLLDSKSLGGADHRTPLFVSEQFAHAPRKHDGNGWRGAFSTWLDVETASRRFYAPAYGGAPGGHPTNQDVVLAFELQGAAEHPSLKPLWTAPAGPSPAPVVIADGMVFVLSTGLPARVAQKNGRPLSQREVQALSKPSTLQVFDAVTGKQLFSAPGAPVPAADAAGLAVANGRAYFTARDNAVYCFGIPAQQSQLY